jgi:large subunit ribosomal protein L28e
MSNDLTWLLLRKNNSFIVKRVPEGPVFSKEPGNLRNLHSAKFSGLVNDKTIHVHDTGNGIQLRSRKSKNGPHTVAKAHHDSTIRPRSGGRRAIGIASSFARRGYRPDLRTVSVFLRLNSSPLFLVSSHVVLCLLSCFERNLR